LIYTQAVASAPPYAFTPPLRHLPSTIARWLLRHAASFLMIVAVLLAINWLIGEARRYDVLSEEVAALRGGREAMARQIGERQHEAQTRVEAIRNAGRDKLSSRIAELDGEIAALQTGGLPPLSTPLSKTFEDHAKRVAQRKVLEAERDYLKLARGTLDYRQAQLELHRLEAAAAAAQTELAVNQADQAALDNEHGGARFVPGTSAFNQWLVLRDAQARLRARSEQAQAALKARQGTMLPVPAALPESFALARAQLDEALAPLDAAIRGKEDALLRNWVKKARGPVLEVLPTALLVLLGVMLTPLAIKALFFFVIAPAAARRPPIRVLPAEGAASVVDARLLPPDQTQWNPSAVSRTMRVNAEHELLVHPEYLQSSAVHGRKGTQWLLDWRCPITSLASGMFGLTRVRNEIRNEAGEDVVISAMADPLSEVAVLTLPEGAALVLMPSCLVAVLTPTGRRLRITRHWRLFSLQAWLTLQLRYLVFHGPVQLAVKGCRGVKVEAAGAGRRINQAATLGFSPHLDYAVVRSEAFWPYVWGEDDLFNDSFAGANGYFVYEEVPRPGKKGGITGRGLEGFTDAVLKAFGIG